MGARSPEFQKRDWPVGRWPVMGDGLRGEQESQPAWAGGGSGQGTPEHVRAKGLGVPVGVGLGYLVRARCPGRRLTLHW